MKIVALLALSLTFAVHAQAQDRMPPIPAEKMTDAQKKAVADYKSLRSTDLTGPPWTVLLRVPDLVVPSLQLRLHNQQNSALSPKLTEMAILIAARHLTNSFEFNAHHTLAVKAGLSADVIAAVAEGRRPERMQRIITETDWERFDGFTPTFTHPSLTHEELLFLLGSAYRLYYIRPSFVTNYLRISAPRVRQLAEALDVHVRRRHASEMAMMERSLSC